ncbi:unnamed protein product [Jaminaea pallidilutea]
MPPESSLSLRGQRVLDEDEYTSSLSSLIQRDFFPALPRLTAENEYLAALQALDDGELGGEERLRAAEAELDRLDERGRGGNKSSRGRSRRRAPWSSMETPVSEAAMDTPLPSLDRRWDPTPVRSNSARSHDARKSGAPTASTSSTTAASKPDLSSHTLSSFQAGFTSEDNASFLDLLRATNDFRRLRSAWAFRKEKSHNERRRLILDEAGKRADEGFARSMMALAGGQRRKLIEGGKVTAEVAARVADLEAVQSSPSSRSSQMITAPEQGPSRRTIRDRAHSEEPTNASEDGKALVLHRTRSLSPPAKSHRLDPQSEIRISTADQPSERTERQRRDDPDNVLQAPPVTASASLLAGTKYAARNALFFGPDADIDTLDKASSSLPRRPQDHESSAQRLFHARESLKHHTNYHNTALPAQGLFPESRYPGLEGKAARTAAGSDAGGSLRSSRIASAMAGGSAYGEHFDDDGVDLREGPQVNGYGFVTPHASPTPSERSANQTQRHPRTMRSLVGSNAGESGSSRPAFAVPPTPRRDELARGLAGRSGGSGSKKQKRVLNSIQRSGAGNLSPAAKSLFDRTTRGGMTPLTTTRGHRTRGDQTTQAALGKRRWEESTPVSRDRVS